MDTLVTQVNHRQIQAYLMTRHSAPFLPAVLFTDEVAALSRLHPETVRQKIRTRSIKAYGRPARIPSRELLRLGVDLELAARLYPVLVTKGTRRESAHSKPASNVNAAVDDSATNAEAYL